MTQIWHLSPNVHQKLKFFRLSAIMCAQFTVIFLLDQKVKDRKQYFSFFYSEHRKVLQRKKQLCIRDWNSQICKGKLAMN